MQGLLACTQLDFTQSQKLVLNFSAGQTPLSLLQWGAVTHSVTHALKASLEQHCHKAWEPLAGL